MGRDDEALDTARKLNEVAPGWTWVLGYTYAITNHRVEAEKILEELENAVITSWDAMGIAAISAALGKMDDAFKWLSYEPHHAGIPWITVMHMGKSFYNDQRINDFLKRTNQSFRYLH